LFFHHRPRRSVPGGLATTHFLYLQTPTLVSCHPLGLRPFGIQPCHRSDTRICAHLGPGSFCGRSSLSPPWLLQSLHLTSWLGSAVNSAQHLPLDSLCHVVSDLIEEIPILPLASTDLVVLLLSRTPSVTYQALRAPLLQTLLADWSDLSPPVPLSYPYSACLTPNAFTALPQFICGRITRCVRVPATLPRMSPGGTGTPAHSARSVRKTMNPSNTRFSTALLRPTLASPISQVWTTLALTVPFGSRFPSSEGLPSISMLLARVCLQPCCAFEPILRLLTRVRTQTVLNTKLPGSAPAF